MHSSSGEPDVLCPRDLKAFNHKITGPPSSVLLNLSDQGWYHVTAEQHMYYPHLREKKNDLEKYRSNSASSIFFKGLGHI